MASNRVNVGVGEGAVAGADTVIVSTGFGSCVAVILYSRESRTGGLAHVVLPYAANTRLSPDAFQFAETAVAGLREEFGSRDVNTSQLVAKLVGGARMFEDPDVAVERRMSIGSENLKVLHSALQNEGIPIVGEDVGGSHGRNVEFHVGSGEVFVSAVGRAERRI